MRKRMTITIEADVPEGTDAQDIRKYITKALVMWGMYGDWDDPLYDGITVRKVTVPKDYRLVRSRT